MELYRTLCSNRRYSLTLEALSLAVFLVARCFRLCPHEKLVLLSLYDATRSPFASMHTAFLPVSSPQHCWTQSALFCAGQTPSHFLYYPVRLRSPGLFILPLGRVKRTFTHRRVFPDPTLISFGMYHVLGGYAYPLFSSEVAFTFLGGVLSGIRCLHGAV